MKSALKLIHRMVTNKSQAVKSYIMKLPRKHFFFNFQGGDDYSDLGMKNLVPLRGQR